MIDHKPECPMLDGQWPKHPLEVCEYCDMIAACEKRVLQDAIAAIEEQQQLWASDTLVRLGMGTAKAAVTRLMKESP